MKPGGNEVSQSQMIRRAHAADVAFLESCTANAYSKWIPVLGREPEPMTVNYAEMVQTGHVWVLEDDKERVALLVLKYEANHLLIFSIAVDPKYQRRGYGWSLMQFVEQEARRKDYPRVQLYTNEHMESNILWYQYLGYSETRREQFRGNMIVYMEKEVA